MSKALETGKSLVELVLAKLPENLRDGVKTSLFAPEAADALTELGARGLAQSDYSRNMDEIRAKEKTIADAEIEIQRIGKEQADWYAANKPALDEYNKIKAGGGDPPKPPVVPPGVTQADLEKMFGEREQQFATVLGITNTLTAKHLRDFNEVLDTNELIDFARTKRVSLADAYSQKFAEQIKAKTDKAETERIDKLVAEKLAAARAQGANQPFPLLHGEPSVLDALGDKQTDKSQYSADAAAAEYARLMAGA